MELRPTFQLSGKKLFSGLSANRKTFQQFALIPPTFGTVAKFSGLADKRLDDVPSLRCNKEPVHTARLGRVFVYLA